MQCWLTLRFLFAPDGSQRKGFTPVSDGHETAARDRHRPMRTVVNAKERDTIKANAKAAGMSVSAFLRAAGCGTKIKSALDYERVMDLSKINADQGRLGGLLKMYLQEPAPDHRAAQGILSGIAEAQEMLKDALRRIKT
jgi:hypothetical protein